MLDQLGERFDEPLLGLVAYATSMPRFSPIART